MILYYYKRKRILLIKFKVSLLRLVHSSNYIPLRECMEQYMRPTLCCLRVKDEHRMLFLSFYIYNNEIWAGSAL